MRALGVLLLLIMTGAATLQAAPPAGKAAEPPQPAGSFLHVAPRAAAVAALAATAEPPAGASCHINIRGNSQGGISNASAKCSGGPVRIGVHPRMLGPFMQNFQGVVLDPECFRPVCLIRFCGNTSVSISNSTITGVSPPQGLGIYAVVCVAESTYMVLRKSNISNNNATALVAAWQAKLHVLTSTLAANMGYGLPGGIWALNNSVVVVAGGSVIMGNTAMNSAGGGVAASDNAVLVLSGGSRVVNNTSTKPAGGGVAGSGYSHVRIDGNSIVCDNKVLGGYGGGVAVGDRAELALVSGTVVCNNLGGSAIGGVLVADAAIATIRNTSISGNRAYGAAGGIGVSERGYVAVLESIISNNTVTQKDELQVGGGALAIRGSANVHLLNGTKLLNNKAVGLSGGAFALDQNASLTLAAGVLLSGNGIWVNTSSPYWVPPAGAVGVAAQASRLEIEEGVVGQDGMLTKCSSSIVLRRRPCDAGEFDGGDGNACLCCPPFTYSFDNNATSCQQCPANALCSADVVSPVVGYWHSSPRSLQMHRCPITGSCKEGGVCLTGHTGNLCGQCAYGFGTTAPLRCGRCMDPRLQLGVYMLLVGATVLFITITVHFTWQDNKSGDKSLRATNLIKVLVQFLQYLVILGSISVPWPAFLVGMFTAATMVFGVGSGQALSLDCWLPQYLPSRLPLALQRQLSYFVGALVVAVACVVLMNLLHVCNQVWKACTHKPTRGRRQQPTPRLHFWSRLRVTLLVTAFYAYPSLVRGALSFFACLRIDDASKQPHPEYSISSHTMGYWVSAIQQECFAGWHQPWALGFGLPAVLLFCVGVPLGMFLFLWYSKAQTTDAAFREHYGFLFRNYTDSKPWWEAVWAVQTVLPYVPFHDSGLLRTFADGVGCVDEWRSTNRGTSI